MRQISYITLDSIQEGVGQSQVLSYLRKLAATNKITLVSFEKVAPPLTLKNELTDMGIYWNYISFGRNGVLGGVFRFVRLFKHIPSSGIIHARSDIAAFASVLRGSNKVIWDCRALMADHRRSLSASYYNHFQALFFSFMEKVIAKKSKKIIVITQAVIPVIKSRYSVPQNKFHHISTCVDTSRFKPMDINKKDDFQIRVLIAGTLSPAYDIELMNCILNKLKKTTKVKVTVALGMGHDTSWEKLDYVDQVLRVAHADMPRIINENDLGFAIWRNDFGIALKSVAATKVAEFLACGVPVVVNSLQGDFGELVSKHKVGVSVAENSDFEIEKIDLEIQNLMHDREVSDRCRNFALKYYSLENAVPLIEDIYKELELGPN
jgi:glycosyltransferase involved in cell wall biosynthesis